MAEKKEKTLDRLADRLEALGDELRVRAHLAGMDAKNAWDSAHLERVGDELAKLRDDLKVQGHLAGLDAKDALNRFERRYDLFRERASRNVEDVVRELSESVDEVTKSLRGGRAQHGSAPSKSR